MLRKFIEKIYISYNKKTHKKEDDVVFDFLNSLNIENKINYLEIGSGFCRFPLLVKNKYKNIDIKCLEKNNDLVSLGIKNNLDVVCGSVDKMNFADQKFDIVHCSHVIEHLDYKSVTNSLDEMLRILKPNGYLIIRSPLMYSGFYFDIDHIRPYPPESVSNYFGNNQQQKVSDYNVLEIIRWYRKEAPLLYNSSSNIAKIINFLLKLSWLATGFPILKPNGYVLILKKI